MALVITYLLYFIVGIVGKVRHKMKVNEHIQTLPEFMFQTAVNHSFSSKILLGKATIVIYFAPDCEHCQQEAKTLRQQVRRLQDTQVVWLSKEPIEKLQRFAKEYGLVSLSTVTVGHIAKETVYETFGFTTVPSILIYNAEGKLVKQYKGETKIEALTANL